MKQCPNCKKEFEDSSSFCDACGSSLQEAVQITDNENSTTPLSSEVENSQAQQMPYQNTHMKKQSRLPALIVAIIMVALVSLFANKIILSSSGHSRLDGIYGANTLFAFNAISFSSDGSFERYSKIFLEDPWELVTYGKYTLDEHKLILNCYDGRVHTFYYSKDDDAMMQDGTNDVYVRLD